MIAILHNVKMHPAACILVSWKVLLFDNMCSFSITKTCCIESKSPDDNLFKYLAHVYADNHPQMRRGDSCPPEIFRNGVTNGAYW